MNKFLSSRWTKAGVFLLSLAPFLYLAIPIAGAYWLGWEADFGANPLEYITHYTGDWTLRFVMITLAVTPLRVLLNRPALTRFRRMLGLFTFFYGCLHLLTWMWFDRQFDLAEMWDDIAKRPYITVGMFALFAMLLLALTSTAGWVRRLGFSRWQKLHTLIYAAAAAGVIHFLWLVKSDIREPSLYGAILAVLLGFRVVVWMKKRLP
jgi:methionine sulfoxide reductase heme-binding subunit